MSLDFGKNSQISFINEAEKYKFIGYLANHEVIVQWENNEQQGAWASEGRLAFPTDDVKQYFPTLGYTAGGSYASRLNCNDFVELLIQLGFTQGGSQDIAVIRRNIPPTYQADFNVGSQL